MPGPVYASHESVHNVEATGIIGQRDCIPGLVCLQLPEAAPGRARFVLDLLITVCGRGVWWNCQCRCLALAKQQGGHILAISYNFV